MTYLDYEFEAEKFLDKAYKDLGTKKFQPLVDTIIDLLPQYDLRKGLGFKEYERNVLDHIDRLLSQMLDDDSYTKEALREYIRIGKRYIDEDYRLPTPTEIAQGSGLIDG